MQFVKSPQVISDLSKFDIYFSNSNIDCWSSESGNIKLYCFTTFYPTVIDLENGYKELRDHVAISFQGRTLKSAAERWNLYLVYLVGNDVPQEVRQRVIHDKFSARKIVHCTGDRIIDDDYVKQIIAKSLLDVDVMPVERSSESLMNVLLKGHPKVASALSQISFMNNRNQLPDLLKILSDE